MSNSGRLACFIPSSTAPLSWSYDSALIALPPFCEKTCALPGLCVFTSSASPAGNSAQQPSRPPLATDHHGGRRPRLGCAPAPRVPVCSALRAALRAREGVAQSAESAPRPCADDDEYEVPAVAKTEAPVTKLAEEEEEEEAAPAAVRGPPACVSGRGCQQPYDDGGSRLRLSVELSLTRGCGAPCTRRSQAAPARLAARLRLARGRLR